ncbi:MAG TPA: FmdB family zinc ribbon protein [Terracidiphilus sp.]|nr:FmdB family zinc ribbon protein [Terracidiphilus sp.]
MPLYAYRCTQCGHRFEKIQSFTAALESECPKCHGVLERPLTAPALQFKGAGWYVNDYASKSSDTSSSESKPAEAGATADAKPAASESAPKTSSDSSTSTSTPAPKPTTPSTT